MFTGGFFYQVLFRRQIRSDNRNTCNGQLCNGNDDPRESAALLILGRYLKDVHLLKNSLRFHLETYP